MSLTNALNQLTTNLSRVPAGALQQVGIGLSKALPIRGDFPTSLNLLHGLKNQIANGATPDKIAHVIQADQALALRVLSLSNYEYYRKGKPIYSLTAAIQTIGTSRLESILNDLAEPKNFNAIYLGRAVAVTMMQQAILASVICTQIIQKLSPQGRGLEEAFLTCALTNMGPLLLAFYQPNLYSGICLDSLDDRTLFINNFQKVVGKSIGEYGAQLAALLALPEEYQVWSAMTDTHPWERRNWNPNQLSDSAAIVTAVHIANLLAHEICYFTGIQGIQGLIRELDSASPIEQTVIEDVLSSVSKLYADWTWTLALKPVRLPEYLSWFTPSDPTPLQTGTMSLPNINERINPFLYELRQCFRLKVGPESERLPHVIHCTLNGLIKGLDFDRAVFFRLDEPTQTLQIAAALGVKIYEPEKIFRVVKGMEAESMPDVQAMTKKSIVFHGHQIFPDAWPFVAFPMVWRDKSVGVFYADRIKRPESSGLLDREEIACTALADEWREVPGDFR